MTTTKQSRIKLFEEFSEHFFHRGFSGTARAMADLACEEMTLDEIETRAKKRALMIFGGPR